ncbi:hypothetical protein, partial [Silvimonas sp.]|uniref:hypothetical protein n=1 Tax=Silvimonas sp. TaxID=2650811 RepID=UPI00284FEDFA
MAALSRDIDTWDVPQRCLETLERICWSQICAPPSIAPPTKRPFTQPSTMNMAQWIGLSKVTAKYLFSQVFDGDALRVICS